MRVLLRNPCMRPSLQSQFQSRLWCRPGCYHTPPQMRIWGAQSAFMSSMPKYPASSRDRTVTAARPPQSQRGSPEHGPKKQFKAETSDAHPKPSASRTVLIYHAGTGKIVFLGLMRAAAFLVFGLFSTVIVPAFYANPESPSYLPPLLFIGGCMPVMFVSYTAGPVVNQISMAIPRNVAASPRTMRHFFNNIPSSARLEIETMKFLFWPRISHMPISELVPASSTTRPVSFKSLTPEYRPWYEGGRKSHFYTAPKIRPENTTKIYHPEVWPQVLEQIRLNGARYSH